MKKISRCVALLFLWGNVAVSWALGAERFVIEQISGDDFKKINNQGTLIGTNGSSPVIFTDQVKVISVGNGSAYALNGQDEVVGQAQEGGFARAFLYQHNYQNLIFLETLGGKQNIARGINVGGHIVGSSETNQSGIFQAFWKSGPTAAAVGIGTLGGQRSEAYAINKNNVIVGEAENDQSKKHAFRYENNAMQDLLPSYTLSSAFAINDAGQIVGQMEISPGVFHAFLWEQGQVTDLSTLNPVLNGPSVAHAINQTGVIVGSIKTASGAEHAFIYHNKELLDLNDLLSPNTEWELSTATDINDHQQIVARGKHKTTGSTSSLLISPRTHWLQELPTTMNRETAPVTALDLSGDSAVFSRNDGTIWVSQEIASQWQAPQALSPGMQKNISYPAVAIDQNTLVVGSHNDGEKGIGAGAVYIFEKEGGSWIEKQKLFASDPKANAYFGWGLGLSGDSLVVGGPGLDKVYVFQRQPNGWTEVHTLVFANLLGYYFSIGV